MGGVAAIFVLLAAMKERDVVLTVVPPVCPGRNAQALYNAKEQETEAWSVIALLQEVLAAVPAWELRKIRDIMTTRITLLILSTRQKVLVLKMFLCR